MAKEIIVEETADEDVQLQPLIDEAPNNKRLVLKTIRTYFKKKKAEYYKQIESNFQELNDKIKNGQITELKIYNILSNTDIDELLPPEDFRLFAPIFPELFDSCAEEPEFLKKIQAAIEVNIEDTFKLVLSRMNSFTKIDLHGLQNTTYWKYSILDSIAKEELLKYFVGKKLPHLVMYSFGSGSVHLIV